MFLRNGCESSVLFVLFIDLFRAKFCMNFLKRRYLYHVLRFYQAFYITMFRQADVKFHWKLQTRLDHRGSPHENGFWNFSITLWKSIFPIVRAQKEVEKNGHIRLVSMFHTPELRLWSFECWYWIIFFHLFILMIWFPAAYLWPHKNNCTKYHNYCNNWVC